METQTLAKRPIKEVLSAMKVGDEETFPMSQYQSLRNTTYIGMRQERALGWRFKLEDIADNPYEFKVTRVS